MLGRMNRFHGQRSLKAVYRGGQNVRGQLISLKHLKNNKESYRVAVVVSRQVSKSAVTRNRIRRRVYAVVRKSANLRPGQDLVFSVYSEEINKLEPDKLAELIDGLLKKT